MSAVLAAAPSIPLSSTAGHYVAAAYIVVLAVILIYVAIMAVRAQRLEGELEDLRRDLEAARVRDQEDVPDAERVLAGGERDRA